MMRDAKDTIEWIGSLTRYSTFHIWISHTHTWLSDEVQYCAHAREGLTCIHTLIGMTLREKVYTRAPYLQVFISS